jgi:hypothetical protein
MTSLGFCFGVRLAFVYLRFMSICFRKEERPLWKREIYIKSIGSVRVIVSLAAILSSDHPRVFPLPLRDCTNETED